MTVMAASDGHWSPEVHWNDDAEPDWSKGVPSMLRLHLLPFENQKQKQPLSFKNSLSLSFFQLPLRSSKISYRFTFPHALSPIPLSPFSPSPPISRLQILFFFAAHWLLVLLRYRPPLIFMDTHTYQTLNFRFIQACTLPLPAFSFAS